MIARVSGFEIWKPQWSGWGGAIFPISEMGNFATSGWLTGSLAGWHPRVRCDRCLGGVGGASIERRTPPPHPPLLGLPARHTPAGQSRSLFGRCMCDHASTGCFFTRKVSTFAFWQLRTGHPSSSGTGLFFWNFFSKCKTLAGAANLPCNRCHLTAAPSIYSPRDLSPLHSYIGPRKNRFHILNIVLLTIVLAG